MHNTINYLFNDDQITETLSMIFLNLFSIYGIFSLYRGAQFSYDQYRTRARTRILTYASILFSLFSILSLITSNVIMDKRVFCNDLEPMPFSRTNPLYYIHKQTGHSSVIGNINDLYSTEDEIFHSMRDINNTVNQGIHQYFQGWDEEPNLLSRWPDIKDRPIDLTKAGILDSSKLRIKSNRMLQVVREYFSKISEYSPELSVKIPAPKIKSIRQSTNYNNCLNSENGSGPGEVEDATRDMIRMMRLNSKVNEAIMNNVDKSLLNYNEILESRLDEVLDHVNGPWFNRKSCPEKRDNKLINDEDIIEGKNKAKMVDTSKDNMAPDVGSLSIKSDGPLSPSAVLGGRSELIQGLIDISSGKNESDQVQGACLELLKDHKKEVLGQLKGEGSCLDEGNDNSTPVSKDPKSVVEDKDKD